MPRSASANLKTHLAGDVTTLAMCWKLTLTDSTVMGFTDHDEDIVYDGVTYKNMDSGNMTAIKAAANLAVDNADADMILDSAAITETDLRIGRYDNASVLVFLINYENIGHGIIKLLTGHLGEVEFDGNQAKVEFRSLNQQLQQIEGRIYGTDCDADLGDTRCKVKVNPNAWQASAAYTVRGSRDANVGSTIRPTVENGRYYKCTQAGTSGAGEPTWNTTIGGNTNDGTCKWQTDYAFKVTGQVTAVDSNEIFYDSALTQPNGFFNFGKIVWTGGNNNGLTMEIKKYTLTAGKIELVMTMLSSIQVGDDFEIYAGCNKQIDDCKTKFDNIYNHRGFPHIPGIDRMLNYPDAR